MRSFHPLLYRDIPASPPHPDGSHYRVAIGIEYWPEGPQQVEKVQMVQNGRVLGRRPPSFPTGSDDFSRISATLQELRGETRRDVAPPPADPILELIEHPESIESTESAESPEPVEPEPESPPPRREREPASGMDKWDFPTIGAITMR